MKKIIYILILTLVVLNSNTTYAQLGNIPFGDCLTKLESNDLIKQLRTEFDSTIIRFNEKKEKTPFNFNDKWKLVYYVHTGYEEDYTPDPISRHIDINSIYQNNKQEKWLTIEAIFHEFNISDTVPANYSKESYLESTFQINRYLNISDNFRGVWTPIIFNNYLIISFSHYYPNGNAHSWLREYFYYFEKQEQ